VKILRHILKKFITWSGMPTASLPTDCNLCNISFHSFRRTDPKTGGSAQSRTHRADCSRSHASLLTYRIPHCRVAQLAEQSFLYHIFYQTFPEGNVTEDEIKAIINEGTEQGTIEEAEQEIIERVFHLGDRNITSLIRIAVISFGLI